MRITDSMNTPKSVDQALRDMEKWIEGLIKEANREVEVAERELSSMGGFEDCGDFYEENVAVAKAKSRTLVTVLIGTQKYRKKLFHQSKE